MVSGDPKSDLASWLAMAREQPRRWPRMALDALRQQFVSAAPRQREHARERARSSGRDLPVSQCDVCTETCIATR
eukprot:11218736-Lingulodinium_polyedra.AAC.1